MEFIGIILIQIVLGLGALGAGAVCFLFVRRGARHLPHTRWLTLLIAFAFPLVVLLYLEAGIFSYGIARYAMGKDTFLDGTYHYPLRGNYQLVIWNEVPERAYIEQMSGPRAQSINDVQAVQVSGDKLLIEAYRAHDVTGPSANAPDRFVIIDTKTSIMTEFASLDALRSNAARSGVSLRLMSTEEALAEAASPGWLEIMLFLCLLVPPVLVAVWLLGKLNQLRHRSRILEAEPQSL